MTFQNSKARLFQDTKELRRSGGKAAWWVEWRESGRRRSIRIGTKKAATKFAAAKQIEIDRADDWETYSRRSIKKRLTNKEVDLIASAVAKRVMEIIGFGCMKNSLSINVKVAKLADRKYYIMYYDCKKTGIRFTRSTRCRRKQSAKRAAAAWSLILNTNGVKP